MDWFRCWAVLSLPYLGGRSKATQSGPESFSIPAVRDLLCCSERSRTSSLNGRGRRRWARAVGFFLGATAKTSFTSRTASSFGDTLFRGGMALGVVQFSLLRGAMVVLVAGPLKAALACSTHAAKHFRLLACGGPGSARRTSCGSGSNAGLFKPC